MLHPTRICFRFRHVVGSGDPIGAFCNEIPGYRWAASLLAVLFALSGSAIGELRSESQDESRSEQSFVEGIYCGVCHTNSSRASAMRDQKGASCAVRLVAFVANGQFRARPVLACGRVR